MGTNTGTGANRIYLGNIGGADRTTIRQAGSTTGFRAFFTVVSRSRGVRALAKKSTRKPIEARGKVPWPKTDSARLELIPQFEPDYSFPVHDIDWEKGTFRPFPLDRENFIDGVLKSALPTKDNPSTFEGKPTSAARYCDYAKHAIAGFEHRKRVSAQSDRRRAKVELESAVASVLKTQQKLERLTHWRELSAYLVDRAGLANLNRTLSGVFA